MRISIITVCYNSVSTIGDTLQSIVSQNHPSIEHIIVDGGSSDGTLDIIRQFPHVACLVSEKDNGLYDAMNKGLKKATGDVIGILNSDDLYLSRDVLKKVSACFDDTGVSAVYGDLQYVSPTHPERVIRNWHSGEFTRKSFYYGWMPPHPTFFVRKEVYEKVGLFNTNLRTAADYEMMLRILLKHRFDAAYIPEVLVKMRAGGLSNRSLKHRLAANREDREAWRLNELKPYFFTLYLKPLRKIFQYLK